MVNIVRFFIILVCAETAFKNGLPISTAKMRPSPSILWPASLFLSLCLRPRQLPRLLRLNSSAFHDLSHLRGAGVGGGT